MLIIFRLGPPYVLKELRRSLISLLNNKIDPECELYDEILK